MIDLGHLGLGPIYLVHGDLPEQSADVIVNEANTHLQMTGGVAGRLRARGGLGIHKEAIRLGPLSLGHVARTGAGTLDAETMYHAILVDFFLGKGMSAKVVTAVMPNILQLAAEDGARSIALPLFGAGGGLGLQTSLEAIIAGLEDAGREGAEDEACELRFLVRDDDEFAAAAEIVRDLKGGAARRDDESAIASTYLEQLMAELGGDFDLG
jgi:O-acetyl-ADP-ribose deacetylase (regulator of RNase III)